MSSMALYIVIDTWVIATISEESGTNEEIFEAAEVLAKTINDKRRVVLDEENKIINEYEPYIKTNFIRRWFNMVHGSEIYSAIRPFTRVKDISLKTPDQNILEVAATVRGKIISGDSHFLNLKGDEKLEKYGIEILSPREFLDDP